MKKDKLYCVYLTIYSGLNLPPFYIGSKDVLSVNKGYHGSVSSKQWKLKWKDELSKFPDLFKTIIISYHDTREEAFLAEEKIQYSLDVVNSDLFVNKGYASKRFWHGQKHSTESKTLMKIKRQQFLNTNKEEYCNRIKETKAKNWANLNFRIQKSLNISNGQNNRSQENKDIHAAKISYGWYARSKEQKQQYSKNKSECAISTWARFSPLERSQKMSHLLFNNLSTDTQINKIKKWKETMSSKTEEQKLEIYNSWKISNEPKHEERIAKMKETVKNRTQEQQQQISEKLSKALKGKTRPYFTCPVCGCSGDIGSMKRWGHGETCIRDASKFRGKNKINTL